MITQSIKLNLIPGGVPERIKVSQYDAGSRILSFTLYNGNTAFTTTGLTAEIRGTKPDKHGFAYNATYNAGVVSAGVTEQMTAVAGDVLCELQIKNGSNILGTANFILEVERAALSDDADISETEIPTIIDAARGSAEAAAASATSAAASASTASTKATAAANSATNAANSASTASSKATAAATSATNAATSASTASTKASEAASSASTASTKATAAANSATNAANSASTASTKAGEAASSASTASTKAGEASASASAASSSASAADTSAETAEAWAVGKKNGTDVPSTDTQHHNNAKYWAEQAAQSAQEFANGVIYKGNVLFANLPTSGMKNGWEYNVTDSFTTDNRFSEGAGIHCEAGQNIIWNGNISKWDLSAQGGVTSFNSRYGAITPQSGDYTASMVGLGNVPNVSTDNQTPTVTEASSRANLASGDTLKTIIGKIKKFFTDLKTVAFTGSYNDLTNKPSIPSAYASNPAMDGTATAGSSSNWSRGDHVHPSDTSKVDKDASSASDGYEKLKGQYAIGDREMVVIADPPLYNFSVGNTSVTGKNSMAIGSWYGMPSSVTSVSGDDSVAIGKYVRESGDCSLAAGLMINATNDNTLAVGASLKTGANNQVVFGYLNEGKATSALEVGNGSSGTRLNIFEIDTDGNTTAKGDITDGDGNKVSDFAKTGLSVVNGMLCITYNE